MSKFQSTKIIELGSCAFRQPNAKSHCRWLHGYRLQSKLWFGCDELDENNWVVDFGSLKGLKKKFEQQFDHTTCIAAGDPALELLNKMQEQDMCDLRIMEEGVGIERFAEWCFKTADSYIKSMTNSRCWVDCVEVWEHEKNSAMVGRSGFGDEISEEEIKALEEAELRLDHGEPLKKNESVLSAEEAAEEIATAVDKKQENNINSSPKSETIHPSNDPKQHKTAGKWVDPKVANKPNSWLF